MESTYKHMKTHDPTEMKIAYHVQEKEYIRAAKLADLSGNRELRDAVCDEGLANHGKLIGRIEQKSINEMSPVTFTTIATVYAEMSMLCRIKGDAEGAESYAAKAARAENLRVYNNIRTLIMPARRE